MLQIELIRISSDSNYLEMILDCPETYHFNKLHVKKYDNDPAEWVDLSSSLDTESTRQVIRINTSIFNGSSLFYVNIGIIENEGEDPISEEVTAVTADVNSFYVYQYDKLNDLLENRITRADFDILTKRFFALFGLKESIKAERYADSEYYYTQLKNEFSKTVYEKRDFEVKNFMQ